MEHLVGHPRALPGGSTQRTVTVTAFRANLLLGNMFGVLKFFIQFCRKNNDLYYTVQVYCIKMYYENFVNLDLDNINAERIEKRIECP